MSENTRRWGVKRASKRRKARRPPARTFVKYALLQAPGLALLFLILIAVEHWVSLPTSLFWGLIAVWLAKDIIMFPLVWRAYNGGETDDAFCMLGARAVVEDRLAPSGYVRVRGELWRAEVMQEGPPIDRGQNVRVRGKRGLTLLVQQDDEGEKEAQLHTAASDAKES